MMKLILNDVSESQVELEEPEIIIRDKKNPRCSYILNPKGGYILITAREQYKVFQVDMNTTIEIIEVEFTPDDILKAIHYP